MNEFLTTRELAERWKKSASSIVNARRLGKGPPFVKLGGIRYKLADVVKYENENTVQMQNIINK
jgi:hypothetical protein